MAARLPIERRPVPCHRPSRWLCKRMTSRFLLNQRSDVTARYIGNEREPLLRIEAAAAQPETLVELAATQNFTPAFGPSGGYPGLRAPAPRDYVETIVRTLAGPIAEAFSLGAIRPVRAKCFYSLITLPAEKLVRAQRAPHVDTVDGWQFAILHYLCDAGFGGTAFYRHCATGFETITEERLPAYHNARSEEGWTEGYIDDGAPWFERTAEIAAEFNSLVVYRSRLLHSGRILSPEQLSPDPRRGRLTANVFVTFEADH